MDYFLVPEQENFQLEVHEPARDFTLGLWGNMSRNPRHKSVDFAKSNISVSIPKIVALSLLALSVQYESSLVVLERFRDQVTEEEMTVTGGVLSLNLFPLPALPKKFDAWTLRPKFFGAKGKLSYLPYPFPTDYVEEEEEKVLEPIHVTMHFPKSAFLDPATCQVMAWNAERSCWDGAGIQNVDINPAQGVVSFDTVHLLPTAMVQVCSVGAVPLPLLLLLLLLVMWRCLGGIGGCRGNAMPGR